MSLAKHALSNNGCVSWEYRSPFHIGVLELGPALCAFIALPNKAFSLRARTRHFKFQPLAVAT
jgi:hypothetical protein